ncbi:hypothetical protein KM043_008589 [Ampulex compressa]|nr:hypothetical protein KM043_008589 [Ampulex compressa]
MSRSCIFPAAGEEIEVEEVQRVPARSAWGPIAPAPPKKRRRYSQEQKPATEVTPPRGRAPGRRVASPDGSSPGTRNKSLWGYIGECKREPGLPAWPGPHQGHGGPRRIGATPKNPKDRS